VAAATRGIPARNRWLTGGLLLGLAGSALVAAGTGWIAQLADGIGQELFNACILGIAVAMLAWHNIWMSVHGRTLAAEARSVGGAIRDGGKTLSVLLVVVAIAVLREGSETVLFLYGVAISGASNLTQMFIGGALGIAAGVAIGITLYRGLLHIPLRWFFTATSILVLLLAAGMAAQAARFLVQADLLPSLASPLWDTSSLLSNESAFGSVLRGLIGYDARPSGIQVVFYATIAIVIAVGMNWVKHFGGSPKLQTHSCK
jgi:high-affinity iron transporter